MKRTPLLLCLFVLSCSSLSVAQQSQPIAATPQTSASYDKLDVITIELDKIVQSVDKLQTNWKGFFASFSVNQGVRLTDRQQKLLFAFEALNRAEQRLGNLQKMRTESNDAQASLRIKLARISDDLLPDSIERYVATRGSLNAQQLRDARRQALQKEQSEANNTMYQLQQDLNSINNEIRSTEQFIVNLRNRIFPELSRELVDL